MCNGQCQVSAVVEGQVYLCNALLYVHSHNDGVLLVEDTVGQNAQDAREDRIKLGTFLLHFFHLEHNSQNALTTFQLKSSLGDLLHCPFHTHALSRSKLQGAVAAETESTQQHIQCHKA